MTLDMINMSAIMMVVMMMMNQKMLVRLAMVAWTSMMILTMMRIGLSFDFAFFLWLIAVMMSDHNDGHDGDGGGSEDSNDMHAGSDETAGGAVT